MLHAKPRLLIIAYKEAVPHYQSTRQWCRIAKTNTLKDSNILIDRKTVPLSPRYKAVCLNLQAFHVLVPLPLSKLDCTGPWFPLITYQLSVHHRLKCHNKHDLLFHTLRILISISKALHLHSLKTPNSQTRSPFPHPLLPSELPDDHLTHFQADQQTYTTLSRYRKNTIKYCER